MNGCLCAFLLCLLDCLNFLTIFFFFWNCRPLRIIFTRNEILIYLEQKNRFDPYKLSWLQGLGFFRVPGNAMEVPPKLEAATASWHTSGPELTRHREGSVPLGRKQREEYKDCSVKIMLLLWLVAWKSWDFFFFFMYLCFFLPPILPVCWHSCKGKPRTAVPVRRPSVLVSDLKEVRNGLWKPTVTKRHAADNKPTAKFNVWVFFMESISNL